MNYNRTPQPSNNYPNPDFAESDKHKGSLDSLVQIASNMSDTFDRNPMHHAINTIENASQNDQTRSSSPLIPNQDSSGKSQKTKRMACVECRQQKSRCDASEKSPAPCSRCSKKGLKCDLKSDYKRTYKRARIAQIEKEFLELKKSLNNQQAVELLAKFPSLAHSNGSADESAEGAPGNRMAYENNNLHHTQNTLNSSKSISSPKSTPNPQFHSQIQSMNSQNATSIPKPISDANLATINKTSINLENTDQTYSADSKNLVESFYCEEKTVDAITLSPETIESLFLEYVENYHPILPVVDVSKGPERIYKLCPALFWVIMFVSLRRFKHSASKHLLLQLSPIVKSILAEIMISPITRYNPTEEDEPIFNVSSVYSVQAFLLYSYWPPITSSLSADSSYNTVNTAFFQAIRIGLHSPSLSSCAKDSKSSKNIQSAVPQQVRSSQQLSMVTEQIKTWVVCNVASQNIATAFGFPACVQFESSIWFYNRADSGIKIPKNLQFMMDIAYFEDQMSKALNSNPSDPCGLIDANERMPLLKLLSKRLDELEIKLNFELSGHDEKFRKFELFSTRIHLLSYYFMDSNEISKFELQNGLIKLYNASLNLIDHTQTCQMNDKRFIKYLPGVHLLNLWQAACIIGKLINSDLKNFVDISLGKQHYEAVINFTAKASILKHDMAYRSSGITRNMWQLFLTLDKMKQNNLSIEIKNRMSASVFFDCLNLLRTQVGMTKLNTKTDDNNPVDDEMDEPGIDENVVSSEEESEEKGNHGANNEDESSASHKSTPASTNSSGKPRKARSLSSTVDAESKARKIIRTIPLDPEPISFNSSKRSSIFKVVNSSNDSSPQFRSDSASPITNKIDHRTSFRFENDKVLLKNSSPSIADKEQSQFSRKQQGLGSSQQFPYNQTFQFAPTIQSHTKLEPHSNQFPHFVPSNESPGQMALENLEMSQFDHEMLWRDVDSVMNDFGFHI